MGAKDGELLVRAARKIVTAIAAEGRIARDSQRLDAAVSRHLQKTAGEKLSVPRGVFVTIKRHSDGELRGCIGFIHPTPLWDAMQRAAAAAAFGDFRFAPLSADELGDVVFEVSVMTEPVLIEGGRGEWKKKIKIGRDGLIIFNGGYSGLLLPQVPTEQGWGVQEFLDNICYKAGLDTDALSDSGTKLMKFECHVFAESEPCGKVVEVVPAAAAKRRKAAK